MKHLIHLLLIALAPAACAAPKVEVPPPVSQDRNGKLQYVAEANGDRVPDFSYAGYKQGAQAIPDVPARILVTPVNGDSTEIIQRAIDHVSSLPEDQRGAVLLAPGRFEIAGSLTIKASGVVLRGSGAGKNGTILIATGEDRRTLITLSGKPDADVGASADITDEYVPVNATKLSVADAKAFKPGDAVRVTRICSAEWIRQLGMGDLGGGNGLGWKPRTRDINWQRSVVAIDGNTLTLDAPITTAIDKTLGGGSVTSVSRSERVRNAGVENLSCESTFDSSNLKDEAHSWFGVIVQNAEDVWVRQVNFSHFAGGAVHLLDATKQVTVEDCKSLAPISEIGGWRRHAFFTQGTLTLFQRCWSEDARHDYAVGFCAAGPNAFVQCESLRSLDDSGAIDSWVSGVLFDNVRIDGNQISFGNRGYKNQFAGWSAANTVNWNCFAAVIVCEAPPGAMNWSFGAWSQYEGNGRWVASDEFVRPTSLYTAQLSERLGRDVATNLMPRSTSETSSPTMEGAGKLVDASRQPAPLLRDWIDAASQHTPIPTLPAGTRSADTLPPTVAIRASSKTLAIQNGWLVIDGKLATGSRREVAWWRGSPNDRDLSKVSPNPVRFVPGRIGWGLTDDLDQLTDSMAKSHRVALEHHYGLWYERRRDDHQRVRRMNGDVWPPFYEQPFARSGQGIAWDGLSKYDLTKYNPWYWSRLKTFADWCELKGLILIQQHYFQHNIIEAGAHWADCPWRSANNINDTGFPEPPPYAGDKRIFMAEPFYDETNPQRRKLHEAFIRKSLSNFEDNHNIIHLTSEEFTGPQHFVEFWLDTIAAWKKDTSKHAIIGLSATKDVQDAILSDPKRALMVDLIDIRYWWYQDNGQAYAPPGGASLAPRQHARNLKPRGTNFDQVYRAVREYRTRFPDKPILYSADTNDQQAWAVLFGGGSLPGIGVDLPEDLAKAIPQMTPCDLKDAYALANQGEQYLLYAPGGRSITIDLSTSKATFIATWHSTRDGSTNGSTTTIQGGQPASFDSRGDGPALLWLRKAK